MWARSGRGLTHQTSALSGRGHPTRGHAPSLSRKGALLATNGLAVVGGALMGGAKLGPTYILIILGRLVVGAYSGTALTWGRGLARGGVAWLLQGAWSNCGGRGLALCRACSVSVMGVTLLSDGRGLAL